MAQVVLLVEDDDDARFIYATCLRHAGFEVIEASNGRQASEAALARVPDLVVLDRRLGDRDGLELATQWRASRTMANVPIIVLTAFTTRVDVEKALAAGCDAFLAKPCPGDVLVAHVHKMLIQLAPTKKMKKVRLPDS